MNLLSFQEDNYSGLAEMKLREAFQKVIQKSDNFNPWEWAEANIILSERSSANAGPYDASFTPAWKWPMEVFADPYVRQLTAMKSVQCGGTQWIINLLLYAIKQMGLPILYVGQTEGDVKKFIKNKYDPVEKTCQPVSDLRVKANAAWNEREYSTCQMAIGWGSSPNVLASASIGLLALDEVDKYKQKDKSEAHPFDLAVKRVTAYPDTHKILVTSTPTVPTGIINREYKKGSMHVGKLKCPDCGEHHEWKFSKDTFSWPDECRDAEGNYDLDLVKEHAFFRCPGCKQKIYEHDRIDMLQTIKYFQTNFKAPSEHISVHVPAFYSPFVSIGNVCSWFLKANKTQNGLRDLHTQAFAIPFQAKAIVNDDKTIVRLQKVTPFEYHRAPRTNFPDKDGNFEAVELPFNPVFISTTVDVQGDHFWIMQCAFDIFGNCAILDWGCVYGYQEIRAWQRRVYSFQKRKRITSRFNLIDAGFEMKKEGGVYDFILQSKGAWLPCVGRNNSYFELIQSKVVSFRNRQFELYSFQDSTCKELLYQGRMKMKVSEQLWLPKVVDNDLINQLTDEQLVEVETKDGFAMEWQAKEKNNHLGDCAKMQIVLWEHLGAGAVRDRQEAKELEAKAKEIS